MLTCVLLKVMPVVTTSTENLDTNNVTDGKSGANANTKDSSSSKPPAPTRNKPTKSPSSNLFEASATGKSKNGSSRPTSSSIPRGLHTLHNSESDEEDAESSPVVISGDPEGGAAVGSAAPTAPMGAAAAKKGKKGRRKKKDKGEKMHLSVFMRKYRSFRRLFLPLRA